MRSIYKTGMLIFNKITDLQLYLDGHKDVGFVPTMGALHKGHLSLIKACKEQCDVTVCSIFVNPIQFNKKEDLEKYPRNVDADLKLLEEEGCDVVFIPEVDEIYPEVVNKSFQFGDVADVMEGEHRPGHFNGVAIVVERLFEIVKPNKAFFGQKDFQQLAIIRLLVQQLKLPIEIVSCPIVRESNGLAMSSRNERLTSVQREKAAIIYQLLNKVKKEWKSKPLGVIKEEVVDSFNKENEIDLEYFEIADGNSLKLLGNWSDSDFCVAFIALNFGDVRLIDNMIIIK